MKTTVTAKIPAGWCAPAHISWIEGNRQQAINTILQQINSFGPDKPRGLVFQFSYYLFLLNDFLSAAAILEHQYARTPDDVEVALNLAVCYSRSERSEEALKYANRALQLQPENLVALDTLAKVHHKQGRDDESSAAGTRTLELKDRVSRPAPIDWKLPTENPHTYARRDGKVDVIAFSMWGKNPRYLRGAIQNILLARDFFPSWKLRFHVDESVPSELVELMGTLGAEVILQPGVHTQRQKLCWRFLVANDPAVGHFLVRDVDSVFSQREVLAVNAWLESDTWFHVIRDWWTHTDLVLAGMWGGVAGVLPSLSEMLASYSPNSMETPNVDQWFLRDCVWGFIRQSCLVHDRCFRFSNSIRLPGIEPEGNFHIGQDEFAVRRQEQETFLQPWIERYQSLQLPM